MIYFRNTFFNKTERASRRYYYTRFLTSLNRLSNLDNNFEICSNDYLIIDEPVCVVRNMYRDSHEPGDLIEAHPYIYRCLGHKVRVQEILKFPRLCVMYSKRILEDRFELAEDVIVRDPISVYFYAKLVIGGRLPEKMHSQLVLRSFEPGFERNGVVRQYFSEFG